MVKTQKQQGFTIVELLIVIVVFGILAALVDQEALKDPKNSATDGTQYNLASAAAANVYSYAVTNAAGTACDNATGNECTQYTLSSDLENDTNNFTKSNLN